MTGLVEPLADPDAPVISELHREFVRDRIDPMPEHFSPVAPGHVPHLRPFDRAAHGYTREAVEAPTPTRRTSWTATELLSHVFPELTWAVRYLLAAGLNILAGPPKVAKSWWALNVAVAVAAGGKALGRIDVEPGAVLYLALEDTGRRMQDRLRKVLGDSPAPAGLTIAMECERMPEGADRIRGWLADHPDARLVVVDVFARVRARSDPRMNLYDADYAAASALKAIADEYGVAMLVVHHTRKGAAEDFLDSVNGSQGLAGCADAVLVLSRARNTSQAVLKVTGRDIEEAQYALEFAADIGAWQMLDGPASDYDLGDTRRRILEYVREHEGATPSQIADATGIKLNTVKVNVRRMVDDQQLDTDGNGHYMAPLSPVTPVTDETQGDAGYTGYSTHESARERCVEELDL